MKTLLTFLAIVLTVQCFGQVAQFDGLSDKILDVGGCDTCGTLVGIIETPITIEDIERWVEHCKKDTLEAIPFEGKGYKYTYKKVVKFDPFKYYFVKDPNDIVGLLKWLKQTK